MAPPLRRRLLEDRHAPFDVTVVRSHRDSDPPTLDPPREVTAPHGTVPLPSEGGKVSQPDGIGNHAGGRRRDDGRSLDGDERVGIVHILFGYRPRETCKRLRGFGKGEQSR